MALTITEKNHWRERIAQRIDKRIFTALDSLSIRRCGATGHPRGQGQRAWRKEASLYAARSDRKIAEGTHLQTISLCYTERGWPLKPLAANPDRSKTHRFEARHSTHSAGPLAKAASCKRPTPTDWKSCVAIWWMPHASSWKKAGRPPSN